MKVCFKKYTGFTFLSSVFLCLVTVSCIFGCLDEFRILIDQDDSVHEIVVDEEPAEPLNIDVDDTIEAYIKVDRYWYSNRRESVLGFKVNVQDVYDGNIEVTVNILQETARIPAKNLKIYLREVWREKEKPPVFEMDLGPIGVENPTEMVVIEKTVDCSHIITEPKWYDLAFVLELDENSPGIVNNERDRSEWLLREIAISNITGTFSEIRPARRWWEDYE